MMNTYSEIVNSLKAASTIVITAHKSPDGDSVGSSLALYQFCRKLGLNVEICHPDPAPKFLNWLDDVEKIKNFEDHREDVIRLLQEADLIFSLDYNEPSRLGEEMGTLLLKSKATKILIDHHLNPSGFADIILSDTSSCSTCQLIFRLIEQSGNIGLLDEKIGTPIYLGILTDSGSFRYNSVKPETHLAAAKLLEAGVKHDKIHEYIYDDNTVNRLRLRGYACSEKLVVLENFDVAYISLSKEELEHFHYEKGDTEGLVNVALSLVGIRIAAFFSESEHEIKISFRSKGKEHPVNVLANEHFSGGGHANAAGGKYIGSLDEAIASFVSLLPKFT